MPGDVSPVTGSSASVAALDVRIISEYDGSGDVVEWFTRAELLCEHRGAELSAVLPLRLTGGAFSVWAQLSTADRGSLAAVKAALFTAFAPDGFAAYDSFISRRLQPGESADVYLADLRRLSELVGGVPDRVLTCAFVAGLPDAVRQVIRAGSRAEALDLPSVVARARAVLSDDRVGAAAAAAMAVPRGQGSAPEAPEPAAATAARAQRRSRPRRCWTCGRVGHLAAGCPEGNGAGSGASAPVPSPAQ